MGEVKVILRWSDQSGVEVLFGGTKLRQLDASDGEVLTAMQSPHSPYEVEALDVDPGILFKLPHDEWLFVETLLDITRKLERPTRYGLVRLSALIRQLLFDERPLVIAINSKFRLRLHYEFAKSQGPLDPSVPSPDLEWITRFPTTPNGLVSVDLENFLGTNVFRVQGIECSVKDLVGRVAHVMGGVHLGHAERPAEHVLAMVERQLVMNESLILHAIWDISRITLVALIPLAKAILKKAAGG